MWKPVRTKSDALAPLLDVVFIILTGLMLMVREDVQRYAVTHVATNDRPSGIPVDHKELPWISLDADQNLTVMGEPVAADELVPRLLPLLVDQENKQVVLKCDPGVRHEHPVRLIERFDREGIEVMEEVELSMEIEQ